MRRRPVAPVGAVLSVIICGAFLCLLFVPARFEPNWRLVPDWRPEIEPLLLVAGLALCAPSRGRMPTMLRWFCAALILVAALVQFADAATRGLFGRELHLYFDLPHVPNLLVLFYDAAGFWRGSAAMAAGLLAGLFLLAVTAYVLAAAERALRPRRRALIFLGLVAVGLVLAAVPVGGETPVATRSSALIARQAALSYRAWAAMHGRDTRYAAALAAPQAPLGALPGLKERDVYIVFFESYGTTVLDDPRYAPQVAPALADFAATVERAGYHLLSSRVLSPTFGGGSWLAHGSIDAGVKLDPLLYRLIAETKRETLPRYMSAAGYRTLAVMPGLKTRAPEAGFWGFDKSDDATELGYQGPAFGWFAIPDQYTLRRFDETEAGAGGKPLFAQIVLVSSHTPFAPVPPYLDDWSDAAAYREITRAEWDRIYAAPDWAHLEVPYVASVVYDLKTLGGWLARRERDGLVVILGDHQPPAFITGQDQPWTVPIHVLSRDPDLVRPFARLGYVEGAIPPRDVPLKGMESFLGDFLAAFAHPAEAAVLDAKPEQVSP
jgi:sulfatase-like protein